MGIRPQTDHSATARSPFWRSRLVAIAMLACVTAIAITSLVTHIHSYTVLDGENRYVLSTLCADPAEVVKMAGVTVGEYDAIGYAGGYNELVIDRSFPVTVTKEETTTELHMTGGTVADAIALAGVDTEGYQLAQGQYTDPVEADMEILLEPAIVVTYAERSETEEIPFESRSEYTSELDRGATKVLQAGVNGSIVRTYRDTFENGELVSTEMVDEQRTEPVEEVVQMGTLLGRAVSQGKSVAVDTAGQPLDYAYVLSGKCTAYTNDRGLCGFTTSTGRPASVGVVAVNPKVIPYGTELYIVSADGSYVYGYAVAGDTGGACMAGRIVCDLFMNTYEECIQFGRREMNVYILN